MVAVAAANEPSLEACSIVLLPRIFYEALYLLMPLLIFAQANSETLGKTSAPCEPAADVLMLHDHPCFVNSCVCTSPTNKWVPSTAIATDLSTSCAH